MLKVPPASIYPKLYPTLTQTHTHMHTDVRSHRIIFLVQGHLTAAAYGNWLWPTNQPTNQQQQQLGVIRRIAGHNSGPRQLLCGSFRSPYYLHSYF